jgi:hypothetical protein
LERNREKYLRTRPEGAGWLADVPAAINDQLQWSEVYTPERRRAYITVSRAWAGENNSAPDFLWDSFFSALLVAQEDEKKASALVRDITSWQNEQGMFAQYGQWVARPNDWIFPVAWGHTQYPVGGLAVSKIYMRRPNKPFLAEIYPRLLKNHRWWFSDRGDGQPWRDGNRNGLLELGSNYPEEIPYEDRQQTAYFESHDDSPQWWHVAKYNEKTNTCELDTVERNCLHHGLLDPRMDSARVGSDSGSSRARTGTPRHDGEDQSASLGPWARFVREPPLGAGKWELVHAAHGARHIPVSARTCDARRPRRSAEKSFLRSKQVRRRMDPADDQPR